ncbi:hypothetical protein LTR94_033351, partial [Friedmanniomyces endolithicus]
MAAVDLPLCLLEPDDLLIAPHDCYGGTHRLLTALLNLSKLEAGGVQPAVAPLALGGLFDELAREFAPVARAKGLTLKVAPSALWIASDRDLLRSMLQNLVANAIRYTDRGRVLIGARRDGERVQIL